VLLAEDDREMRRLLAWSMQQEGFSVTECRDGIELMKKLGLHGPVAGGTDFDVIVSDIRMPGASGLQALSAARELEELPPVVFITAFADQTAFEEAVKLGAADVFAKPFDTNDLMRRLKTLAPARDPGTPAPSAASPPAVPVEVMFRHGEERPEVTAFVRDATAKLRRHRGAILQCRVVLDGWSPSKENGRSGHVRVWIRTSTGVVVANEGHDKGSHSNVYLAIRLALAKASRRLERQARRGRRASSEEAAVSG
jgi:CheY-like chemotaxis protein/ribosome-associated translation inhibitor RaiA